MNPLRHWDLKGRAFKRPRKNSNFSTHSTSLQNGKGTSSLVPLSRRNEAAL